MAAPVWSKMKIQYDKLIPKRFQEDFLTEKDKKEIIRASDKRIAKLHAESGRGNNFPKNAFDVLPEEREKMKDMYFTPTDYNRIKTELNIQDAFTNVKIKENVEAAFRAKESKKIREISEAAKSGILLPDGVNFYSQEGKAHIARMANKENMTVDEYISQSKETKIKDEKDTQNEFIQRTANEAAEKIVEAAKNTDDMKIIITEASVFITEQIDISLTDASEQLKDHTTNLIEKLTAQMAKVKLEEGEGEGAGGKGGKGGGGGGDDEPDLNPTKPKAILLATKGGLGTKKVFTQTSGNPFYIAIRGDKSEPVIMSIIVSIKLKQPDTYIVKGNIEGVTKIAHIGVTPGDKEVQFIEYVNEKTAKQMIRLE
jgi:hypothetical protein